MDAQSTSLLVSGLLGKLCVQFPKDVRAADDLYRKTLRFLVSVGEPNSGGRRMWRAQASWAKEKED